MDGRKAKNEVLWKSEKGQGLVEYALIIVMIAIVVIVAMRFIAPNVGNVFSQIGNTLEGV